MGNRPDHTPYENPLCQLGSIITYHAAIFHFSTVQTGGCFL